jgi:ATP-dependent DNA helicase RecQ
MKKYIDILSRYWGYTAFRPLQLDIICSVGEGKDTLGLMPTGGGKSLTFQVPAMAMEGLCIVITPLIALMKDQVENIRKRGIKAAAVYSGMTREQIIVALENCIYGDYKFLYISPERLMTELFLTRLPHMKVCLLAVDESHCISQWGYDFRPSYLRIAEVRKHLPDVPVLALTATATPEVVKDIQQQLRFSTENVFQKSFERKNLVYVVRTVDDKPKYLLKILNSVKGSAIVYVRDRKKTKEFADFLNQNGILAAHFHAGLSNETKDLRQAKWKSGECRVIVATNAFGMGIDKPDVRVVIHMDLPDSIEAYFQEAGRAGRDEKMAYAVLLYNKTDEKKLKKRIADAFPEKEKIRVVYEKLGSYFQLAVGFGLNKMFDFDLNDFCQKFHLSILPTYNSLKILQQGGYIELTDELENPSLIYFTVKKENLYNLKLKDNEDLDKLLQMILRSYTGVFTDFVPINENALAKRLEISREQVYQQLLSLGRLRMINYIPQKKTPYIIFTQERQETRRIVLGKQVYDERKERFEKRIAAVLHYAGKDTVCRSRVLLHYFGQKDTTPCGQCDVCIKHKEQELAQKEVEEIKLEILQLFATKKSLSLSEIVDSTKRKEKKVLEVLRFMLDNQKIVQTDKMKFIAKE